MNRKQLFVLVAVGLVLAGLALYFNKVTRAEYQSRAAEDREELLGDFPANDVTHVVVRSPEGEVNLAKDDVWVVRERHNYPASFSSVAELVRKLWELKPAQSQSIGASQWGRLQLLPPDAPDAGTNAATLVELKGANGQVLRSLLLGRQQMRDSGGQFGGYPVGRWVALPDRKDTVYVVSETFSEVEVKPENWLNKDFFRLEKTRAISLVSTNPAESWSLSRATESGDWELADARDGEALDRSKASSFNWAFSSPSFNDVFPPDAEGMDDAFANPTRLTFETFEGFRYAIEVGTQPDADSYYLKVQASAELPRERTAPEDETPEAREEAEKTWREQQDKLREKLRKERALANWVYKVSKWSVDSVLKDRSGLLTDPTSPDFQDTLVTPDGFPSLEELAAPLQPPLPGEIDLTPPLAPPDDE
ncbi:MAG: DUF4340 domain-containing protein [Verrucomicrobiae bacterium]|nr:DUF4340 domain-containing protein [Verrucomicrobiae bacterium]